MLVKNLRGTSDHTCKCNSWLSHWGIYSSGTLTPFTLCCVTDCSSASEVGAHVQINSGLGGLIASRLSGWYIVPMCQSHNMQEGELYIDDSTPVASANVSQTCGQGIASLQ